MTVVELRAEVRRLEVLLRVKEKELRMEGEKKIIGDLIESGRLLPGQRDSVQRLLNATHGIGARLFKDENGKRRKYSIYRLFIKFLQNLPERKCLT